MTDKLDDGIVEIHGKQYLTVGRRLADFRSKHPDWSIKTKLLEAADLVRFKASIVDDSGRVIATGYAEEIRNATNILKTSAVETCETSAVGRALGFIGLGGTAIASAEEMELALEQQKELAGIERLIAHNRAVRDNIESVIAVKHCLLRDDFDEAYTAWAEIDPDDLKSMWVAPSKGGIWATDERAKMKDSAWNDARKAHFGIEDE